MLELGRVLHYISRETVFIQIDNGKITGITTEPTTERWIDCNNNTALPGLIDGHVHGREDQPHKETQDCLEKSAILGGVTTMVRMPNQQKPAIRAESIIEVKVAVGQAKLNNLFWLGATNDNVAEIGRTARHVRKLCGQLKIYMGSSTGSLLVTDPETIMRHMAACAENNMLCGVHAEDEALMKGNLERLGRAPKVPDHCSIRSTEVEVSAVRLALKLQRRSGCKLYFCHISCPESLEIIQDAKQEGRQIYAEVCPHHLFLFDSFMEQQDGGKFKMNPPLRTPSQVKRMQDYICRPGWVDCICSDHAPHKMTEEKLVPEDNPEQYKLTASGVPGIQTILPLVYGFFVRKNGMTLKHFSDLTSGNLARILGLESKGRLEVGADADLAVINEKEIRSLKDEDMATLWKWTPFAGFRGCGFPSHVVAGGQLVYPF